MNKDYEIRRDGTMITHKGKTPRVLSQRPNKYGYIITRPIVNGKRRSILVHRLVALKYIPNLENKKTVNHKDGDKTNNHVDNLEWMTQKENSQHAVQMGLMVGKIDDVKAGEIREKYSTGNYTQKELGKMYDVHPGFISRVVNFKRWTKKQKNY